MAEPQDSLDGATPVQSRLRFRLSVAPGSWLAASPIILGHVRLFPRWRLMVGCVAVLSFLCSHAFASTTAELAVDTVYVALMRVATLLIAGGIGFAVGAFFSPALEAIRRIILKIGVRIVAVGFGLYLLFGPAPFADHVTYVVAIVFGFWAAAQGMQLGAVEPTPTEEEPSNSFGSAKWATLRYLQTHDCIGTTGFALGGFRSGGVRHPLRYEGARHLLTVAPTRSGKGVSSIIPNLLTYEGSAFVIDPKGENALVTAYRRGRGSPQHAIAGMGQDVFLLDPWDIAASRLGARSACFNPLDWIMADDPDAAENALLLADALVPEENRSGGENRFWDDEAKALLAGIILYVATAPEEAEHRHLGRVRDILTGDEEKWDAVLTAMVNHPHPVVASTGERTAAKDPKLRSNVITGTQAHTHFLDSPRIRESLSRTDFRFEDLKTRKMTVYLILPADRLKTFDRWLRLLIQQAITVNARNIAEKPARPVLFLLDEMAALGRLTAVEQAFGLMAGFGMQLWGIVQDLSQLARIYGEHGWQTFISNSGVIQYFGSRDKMTAEYFSTLCGVTTVEVRNFSWAISKALGSSRSSTTSYGAGGGSSSTSGSSDTDSWTRTTGVNESQRKLAYPDELMVLKRDQQIVFIENLDPASATKLRWYEEAEMKQLGVDLHRPAGETLPPEPPPGMGPAAEDAAAA
jgi:type IV secretory pathway TraG/TraD family ATPase VirD4